MSGGRLRERPPSELKTNLTWRIVSMPAALCGGGRATCNIANRRSLGIAGTQRGAACLRLREV